MVADSLDEAEVRVEEVEAELGVVELGGFEFDWGGFAGKELFIESRGFEGRPAVCWGSCLGC